MAKRELLLTVAQVRNITESMKQENVVGYEVKDGMSGRYCDVEFRIREEGGRTRKTWRIFKDGDDMALEGTEK